MDCDAAMPVIGMLFWGLPIAAVYWIRRRRQIAGASLTLGRTVLILWFLTFPVLILSLFLGFSRLEGNYRGSTCWMALATFTVLIAAYVLLFRSLKPGPGAK